MSVRLATPDSAVFPAAGRLIVAVAALIVLGSGLSTGSSSAPGYRSEVRLSAEANEMMVTIEALSGVLTDHESPELAIAWEDLRSDLESLSRDLESARFSLDVDGLVERVERFREEFATARGMSEKAEVWDQLTNQLRGLESPTQ
jgi:hypothetical protein